HDDRVALERATTRVRGELDVTVAVVVGEFAAPVVDAAVAGSLDPQQAGLPTDPDGVGGATRGTRAVAARVAGEAERTGDDRDLRRRVDHVIRLDRLFGGGEADRVVYAEEEQVRTRRHLVDDLGDRGAVFGQVRIRAARNARTAADRLPCGQVAGCDLGVDVE